MDTIDSVDAAESWFLSHSFGEVNVINTVGETKVCDNYKDAVMFLTTS